jgi:antitoxin CptB
VLQQGKRCGYCNWMPADEAARRKRLLFQCQHRGTKELDYMLGAFARAHIASLTSAELATLESLLAEPEWDVFAWLTRQAPAPAAYAALVARIAA